MVWYTIRSTIYFTFVSFVNLFYLLQVLDFVSMNVASQRYNPSSQDGGWYKVAWGFLKVRMFLKFVFF